MNVLFVTPSQVSSGEAVTALHMAEWLAAEGCRLHFLASEFTGNFVRSRLGNNVSPLGHDLKANQHAWYSILHELRPAAVVFADYPLLAFRSGTVPLRDKTWEQSLDRIDAGLFTLDHLGYAQRSRIVFFGPALTTLGFENILPIPASMRVLLPCPLHDPDHSLLRGIPFRYWKQSTEQDQAAFASTRGHYVRSDEELLVLHLSSQWAHTAAELLQHPYYSLLPEMISGFLSGLGRPVIFLSVNNGRLLPQVESTNVRTINAKPVDPAEFERLLLVSDLVVTENRISVSLAKAICQLRPCAVLHNSYAILEIAERKTGSALLWAEKMEHARFGSVFPFEVFPIWSRADLQELAIFDATCLGGAFAAVEIFGGEASSRQLQALLADSRTREAMRAAQQAYLRRVESLPTPQQVLAGAESTLQGAGQHSPPLSHKQ
jgi:hypothetical protein